MNEHDTELYYLSSDKNHRVHGVIFRPAPGVPVRGVIQIAHGMIDHIGRYEDFARKFCEAGFVVGGNDHLGHGKNVWDAEEYGFFAEKNGIQYVLEDMHTMTGLLKKEYPGLPFVLLGHSMGSFFSRLYAVTYGQELSGLIIHGTGGPNPALPVGKALSAVIRLFAGPRHRSKFLADLTFAGYNSHFDKAEGPDAWLSRDGAYLHRNGHDEMTGFIFTVAAYQDLFRLVGRVNSRRWFEEYPKTLPTLLVSGTEDPVGAYGKGPTYVHRHLMMEGVSPLSLRLYEGARHELFNETCRDEVAADILSFIGESVL